MKMNKYLKELGYRWEDLPGNYNHKLIEKDDMCAAADIRNKERKDGMCTYEFFSLDHTLALYIYPRLCYFRDNIMKFGTPGCFSSYGSNKEATKQGQKMWEETVNKMCEAFRLILSLEDTQGYEAINQRKINEGLHLFAEYYNCLWY